MNNGSEFDSVIKCLPVDIEKLMYGIDTNIKNSTFEIKIRVNLPIVLYGKYGTGFIEKCGKCVYIMSENCLTVSKSDMKNIIGRISEYSIHSKQSEIINGFITYDKNRIGLCGKAIYDGEKISNITDFSSLTLRISRNVKGCSAEIIGRFFKDKIESFIIAGPPCSGKTTVLRDLAVNLSTSYSLYYPKIVVIDERYEFAGADNTDMGLCDVLKGYSKCDGIVNAVRTLSPDVIICDEITTMYECENIARLQNNGVKFICSVHCENINELIKKDIVKLLFEKSDFKGCILLGKGENTGKIADYFDCEEYK